MISIQKRSVIFQKRVDLHVLVEFCKNKELLHFKEAECDEANRWSVGGIDIGVCIKLLCVQPSSATNLFFFHFMYLLNVVSQGGLSSSPEVWDSDGSGFDLLEIPIRKTDEYY